MCSDAMSLRFMVTPVGRGGWLNYFRVFLSRVHKILTARTLWAKFSELQPSVQRVVSGGQLSTPSILKGCFQYSKQVVLFGERNRNAFIIIGSGNSFM
jgi:hypothetical protein